MSLNKRGNGTKAGFRSRLAGITVAAALLSAAAYANNPTAPVVVTVTAGAFITGSDRTEREAAYQLDEKAYGHRITREQRWYESERERQTDKLPTFNIMKNLVTNADYQTFVDATGHPAPGVDRATWEGYGLIHPWERTRRFAWVNGKPPDGRLDHPVVLVSRPDARAYAAWLTKATGKSWRLPTELEWEKAARGVDGRRFPWGNGFSPQLLNSHDAGPFDTVPVGSYPRGASPFGMNDAAGQVFEWTATSAGEGRAIVKGGSWDDKGCGVCRSAARHSRPVELKHILIGFRLVRE